MATQKNDSTNNLQQIPYRHLMQIAANRFLLSNLLGMTSLKKYFVIPDQLNVLKSCHVSLGELFDWENYSKIFGIHFIIWYPNQVKTDNTHLFPIQNKYLLKSNNVEYSHIMAILGHFRASFTCFLHYSTLTNQVFQSKPNNAIILIHWY